MSTTDVLERKPRLSGVPIITERHERLSVFSRACVRRNPMRLDRGDGVVLAITRPGLAPVFIDLGPWQPISVAAALIAAVESEPPE